MFGRCCSHEKLVSALKWQCTHSHTWQTHTHAHHKHTYPHTKADYPTQLTLNSALTERTSRVVVEETKLVLKQGKSDGEGEGYPFPLLAGLRHIRLRVYMLLARCSDCGCPTCQNFTISFIFVAAIRRHKICNTKFYCHPPAPALPTG